MTLVNKLAVAGALVSVLTLFVPVTAPAQPVGGLMAVYPFSANFEISSQGSFNDGRDEIEKHRIRNRQMLREILGLSDNEHIPRNLILALAVGCNSELGNILAEEANLIAWDKQANQVYQTALNINLSTHIYQQNRSFEPTKLDFWGWSDQASMAVTGWSRISNVNLQFGTNGQSNGRIQARCLTNGSVDFVGLAFGAEPFRGSGRWARPIYGFQYNLE